VEKLLRSCGKLVEKYGKTVEKLLKNCGKVINFC
jgi:hypothetical protein